MVRCSSDCLSSQLTSTLPLLGVHLLIFFPYQTVPLSNIKPPIVPQQIKSERPFTLVIYYLYKPKHASHLPTDKGAWLRRTKPC